jgi:preprotein translocase subunit SecE
MAEAGHEGERPKVPKIGSGAFAKSWKKGGFKQFFNDVKKEMLQTTWPTSQETWRFTGVVLGVIGIFGLFLYGVDQIMRFVFEHVLLPQKGGG